MNKQPIKVFQSAIIALTPQQNDMSFAAKAHSTDWV
jgi:hypothetical protein